MNEKKEKASETSTDAIKTDNFYGKLLKVQQLLKAPKNQYNTFGKYKYRTCEDILEALKPLLADAGLALCLSDDVVEIKDRLFLKATANLKDIDNPNIWIFNVGLAEIPPDKKGMDLSQVTGTASSYARKYCLNGLFLIDDTKDADTNEQREEREERIEREKKQARAKILKEFREWLNLNGVEEAFICDSFKANKIEDIPTPKIEMTMASDMRDKVMENYEIWKSEKSKSDTQSSPTQ